MNYRTTEGRVLVTGANGFVGLALCRRLLTEGFSVNAAVRRLPDGEEKAGLAGPDRLRYVAVGDIGPDTDWSEALAGVDVVIHLAAHVHADGRDEQAFYRVNAAGTERLAQIAASRGVSRMVYVSSIKVNGERTLVNAFSEADVPAPQNAYALSKWLGERALMKVAEETGLQVVALRPPLVYGAGAKGNFLRLMQWIVRGVPLPLAAIDNRRTLLGLDNLVDALILCAVRPEAAGKTYLLGDTESISTPDLYRRLAAELECPAKLFSLPPGLLRFAGVALGRAESVDRLLDSLEVDTSLIRAELSWTPPCSLARGLHESARWYRQQIGGTY
ncbi:MAG: NAD-dependent epimerase/dehydratase family protein [Sulfuricellaceae bacterium]|nr:NAD-dependent epimerase/dehydratase family protein [Sulfuricellaceae bacterium]